MTRGILILVGLLLAVACVDTMTVSAGNSKNPYSSYNISGVNYGAQQWDRTHGKSTGKSSTYGRRGRR
ncbi:hypothetical protein ETAA8_62540 [Anatilimnocola aggregata]|uniref:Uncharacterized protein n=1 Tax=Anatilimnocola aggregata TaxID=2528021 RepID=A0A517YLK7_9BACT|nr:hypothetical protein [Anatilimnocola aggregata]QDU31101.1 hypothetical protein ETAA8_62540 [Anatilimnocola aggregata]